MPNRYNSGQVSDWGVNRGEIALGVGGALQATKSFSKTGVPNVSMFFGSTTLVLTQNFRYAYPFIVYDPINVDAYLTRPNAGSAAAVLKAYIYRMQNETFGVGETADFVTGTDVTIDVTAAGAVTTLLSSAVTLNSGFYFVLLHSTVANSPTMWAGTASTNWWFGSNLHFGNNMAGRSAGTVVGNNSSAPGLTLAMFDSGVAVTSVPFSLRWT